MNNIINLCIGIIFLIKLAAMDIYQTDNINGDTILKNQDTEEIERSVEPSAPLL